MVIGPDGLIRCWWCAGDERYEAYHDEEWGRGVHDDTKLFEKLCLEGFQAGLSWLTILRKRKHFRAAFAGFSPRAVAAFDGDDIDRLLGDAGIVRNRAKIQATIGNARALCALWEASATLDELVWAFADDEHRAPPRTAADVPATTPASRALSTALKSHGFRFVGPTTCYAFMQAMGLVNDHLAGCDMRAAARA